MYNHVFSQWKNDLKQELELVEKEWVRKNRLAKESSDSDVQLYKKKREEERDLVLKQNESDARQKELDCLNKHFLPMVKKVEEYLVKANPSKEDHEEIIDLLNAQHDIPVNIEFSGAENAKKFAHLLTLAYQTKIQIWQSLFGDDVHVEKTTAVFFGNIQNYSALVLPT